ncbi:M48 family metallopeptidase [bacterium]|nr:M48 family metallopeptidase [bacterium]
MITFTGTYFDGKSSRAHEVTVSLVGGALTVRGETLHLDIDLGNCTIEPALGSTRRTLYTPGGGRLDTEDRQAFAVLEKLRGGTGGFQFIHWLESHWKVAAVAVGVTIVMVICFSVWGIPYLARIAAFSMPEKANQVLGKGVLETADRHFFQPTELAEEQQKQIRTLVWEFVHETGAPEPRAFEFRKSPFGPNAFALPGDTVVLTDELVSFVESDGEILGVVAHELAHLENRHAVRTVLQSAGVFVLVSVTVGDVISVTSVAGTLPALLLKSSYSRGFEREADDTASRWMVDTGHGVRPMIAFLTRVEEKDLDGGGPEFLSTHPAPENRIERLRELVAESGGGLP